MLQPQRICDAGLDRLSGQGPEGGDGRVALSGFSVFLDVSAANTLGGLPQSMERPASCVHFASSAMVKGAHCCE
jgi:hypothetical protein